MSAAIGDDSYAQGHVLRGYLVYADISGYTSYVAQTELAHSRAVLEELLELLVKRLTTVLTLSKLEGDAVFAYVVDSKIPRGEMLLELIEDTYVAFRDRVEGVRRHTTCDCNACRAIPLLDLKFIVHHGEFARQNVVGIHELIGSDVNLIHRLAKNHVAEATGWRAYVLLTHAALQKMGIEPQGMHEQRESYEHLGDVVTLSVNLRPRYEELAGTRRNFVSPEEADFTFAQDFPVPPPVVWEWINDPHKRERYSMNDGIHWITVHRPGGRTGPGTRNHCLHGKNVDSVEEILDWKPFRYVTSKQEYNGITGIWTFELEPLPDNGTRLHAYLRGKMPVPAFLNRLAFKTMHGFMMGKMMSKMKRLIEADADQSGLPAGD